eukprot:m.363246 g.363246  ORF g.363246 m.363246 type:complete len:107 (+) comp20798_c0_seq6:689-1009(+)
MRFVSCTGHEHQQVTGMSYVAAEAQGDGEGINDQEGSLLRTQSVVLHNNDGTTESFIRCCCQQSLGRARVHVQSSWPALYSSKVRATAMTVLRCRVAASMSSNVLV